MKTRIFTGAVIAAVVAAAVVLVHFVPQLFQLFASVVGTCLMVEVLYNTNLAKKWPLLIAAVAFLIVSMYFSIDFSTLVFLYLLFLIVYAVFWHDKVSLNELCYAFTLPVYITYSLRCLFYLLVMQLDGLFLLFILLSVTSIADIGAYFTGVLIGKHKMSPVISPKKTYEGLVGGIVFGEVAVFLVCFIFKHAVGYLTVNYVATLLFAPLLILAGVLGDLFASLVKRHAGIKDYGTVFPGHGGFMDRLDSILAAAPLMLLFNSLVSFSGM